MATISRYWGFDLPDTLSGQLAIIFDIWAASSNIGRLLQTKPLMRLVSEDQIENCIAQWPDSWRIGETIIPALEAKHLFNASNHPFSIEQFLKVHSISSKKMLIFMSNNGTHVAHNASKRNPVAVLFCGLPYISAVADYCKSIMRDNFDLNICCIGAGERKFKDKKAPEDMFAIDCFEKLLKSEAVDRETIQKQVFDLIWENYYEMDSPHKMTADQYKEGIIAATTLDQYRLVPKVESDKDGLYARVVTGLS